VACSVFMCHGAYDTAHPTASPLHLMCARACPRFNLVQATVKVDYGPRKQVTLQFFYPSQAASRKMDSPLGVGTEV